MVADVHPLVEGHLLIIPKYHLPCVGAYPEELFHAFIEIYQKFSEFLMNAYRSVSSFEHGVIGQTVFHSHVHLLPFDGKPEDIVPEGIGYLTAIPNLSALKDAFSRDGKYLFFSIGNQMWLVHTKLGTPLFFRDRFAQALGVTERGNWKTMRVDTSLMAEVKKEIHSLKRRWKHDR